MMKEVLQQSSVINWQQLALLFFIFLFLTAVVVTFRKGSKQRLEDYKNIPLDDSSIDLTKGAH